MENMKNMIELPGKQDFYRTQNIEVTQDEMSGVKKIHHRNCNIAMRSIIDFTSIESEHDFIDEEKMPDYEKAVSEYKEKCKSRKISRMAGSNGNANLGEEMMGVEYDIDSLDNFHPEFPTKRIKFIGTIILYFNGQSRIIVDSFQDFE